MGGLGAPGSVPGAESGFVGLKEGTEIYRYS